MAVPTDCDVLKALAAKPDGTYDLAGLAGVLGVLEDEVRPVFLDLVSRDLANWGDVNTPWRLWITDAGRDYVRSDCGGSAASG